MSARHAATANRRLNELHTADHHHVVKAAVRDYTTAANHARASGARLVTGTARHLVAHFNDRSKAEQYHRSMKASGHADAALHHIREK